jgi:hypothetical protein
VKIRKNSNATATAGADLSLTQVKQSAPAVAVPEISLFFNLLAGKFPMNKGFTSFCETNIKKIQNNPAMMRQ